MSRVIQTVSKWDLRFLTQLFVVLGVVLAAASGYMGYTRLYLDDEQRFWSAIEQSMAVPSVTRTIKNGGTGNQFTQQQQFVFGNEPFIVSKVSFDQISSTLSTSVVTEGLLYLDEQYSRYTKLEAPEIDSSEDQAVVADLLGKWESNSAQSDEEQLLATQSYMSELAVLAIFGNFDANFRQEAIASLRDNNTYRVDFKNVSESDINGEEAYAYNVDVHLASYARLLFDAFKEAGYGEYEQLRDPQFSDDATEQAIILVSKDTGMIVGLQALGRNEEYSGHGIFKNVERPEAVFTGGELEEQVRQAVQGDI